MLLDVLLSTNMLKGVKKRISKRLRHQEGKERYRRDIEEDRNEGRKEESNKGKLKVSRQMQPKSWTVTW